MIFALVQIAILAGCLYQMRRFAETAPGLIPVLRDRDTWRFISGLLGDLFSD